MLQIKDWIICYHEDKNTEPVYDAIDLKIIWWNDDWMIDLWTDMYWTIYHDLAEIKAYHQKVIAAHGNVFFGLNAAISSDNQEAAQSSMKALRKKIEEGEWREMSLTLERMKDIPEELSISPVLQDETQTPEPTPIKEVEQNNPEKKLSPTSKKEVTKKEDKSISNISQNGVEVFRNLSHIRTERNIDLRVLKNGLGKRVFEVEGGFILSEDIVEFWLKELAKNGITLITNE